MQSLTNSRVRPLLLCSATMREYPELSPAAAALKGALNAAGGACCGSSREQQEVDALSLALQILSSVPIPRLISFLRQAGFRGPVKVYRKTGGKKERAVIDAGA